MTPRPNHTGPRSAPVGEHPVAVMLVQGIRSGTGSPPEAEMLCLLDDVERRRAARIADAAQAVSFVAGRQALRVLAASLLGVQPADLASESVCPVCSPGGTADHGRPGYTLDGGTIPLALSLSRADGFILLGALDVRGAVPDAIPRLGIDLTAVAEVGFDGFDDVSLTTAERDAVRTVPVAGRGAARARLWARKEALVKALGTGFTDRDPSEVDVLTDGRISDLPSVDGVVLASEGLVAAVAVIP
ncbi:4'-phosphopantetheinyl transferase superfamily protein [Arthrobacter cheniae]|uniref:4'-phosphopantetheinyl transferase superfamily protein n=1 Tax=Arthrobacter cheniae TaxID=1258888 RepID=A0A3A5M879_9MICC|nr:4'-phosphopantetheinyl transferase family protein [Arthrobacter cheniae]RJT83025.1 4'-phosphopantetheinyl transferase superfamily protein [Arthrobacter cheniae]